MKRTSTAVEERGSVPVGDRRGESPDSLTNALERIGCQPEPAHAHATDAEASSLPSVTFRAPGALLTEILELVSELTNRPPSRARLSHVWSVESRPSRHGGILHTLAPTRENAAAPLLETDLQAARRDSETLAAFLLLRRGQPMQAATRATSRRPTRMPAARPTQGRVRGYFRGTLSIVPPVAAG